MSIPTIAVGTKVTARITVLGTQGDVDGTVTRDGGRWVAIQTWQGTHRVFKTSLVTIG